MNLKEYRCSMKYSRWRSYFFLSVNRSTISDRRNMQYSRKVDSDSWGRKYILKPNSCPMELLASRNVSVKQTETRGFLRDFYNEQRGSRTTERVDMADKLSCHQPANEISHERKSFSRFSRSHSRLCRSTCPIRRDFSLERTYSFLRTFYILSRQYSMW